MFNEKKATEVAIRVIEQSQDHQMNYLKLINLLYLIDRHTLIDWGKPIIGDIYEMSMNGMMLSHILRIINNKSLYWHTYISSPNKNNTIQLKQQCSLELLSKAEINTIDIIFEKYGHLSMTHLIDYIIRLPEWNYPNQLSNKISYADILRSIGRTEEQIHSIEQEITYFEYIDEMFT